MIDFKCKMCGGDLVLVEGQSVAECEYCGSRLVNLIEQSWKVKDISEC